MQFGVVRLPNATAVDDIMRVVDAVDGASGRIVEHDEDAVGDVDGVILVGGDSGGAASCSIISAVGRFAADGHPVLGVGDGFQILCEVGLLDGNVERSEAGSGTAAHCVVEGRPTPFTHAIPAGRHLEMSATARSGRYSHPDVETLESQGRVVFRYCTHDGEVCSEANPTESTNNIAGICNDAGNVVGLLPIPERTVIESALAHHVGTPARVGG